MTLRVYNTLTRQKEDFKPVTPGKVGMYVCGPTVYKPSHVGHMVGPVIFDTVKRYLQYLGFQVTFVVNITDIDDKIINEAAKLKRDWKELAESVTADYLSNLKQLGVTGIDHFPRATEYVGEIHRIIQGLIDRGYAYASAGDVYFDVTKDADYGKLCNRDPEQLEAGARIEVSSKKRGPGDFALWKGAKPGEPKWDSPWGPGRPGWHIECSAMSMKLLGHTLDIHGGGLDLQFPHHENELAQSESLTDQPFARYWMHNGLMKTGDQKMSKSAGNEIVVSEVLKKHAPETLRFLLLSTHYRSPIEYSEKRLVELGNALQAFERFFERYQDIRGHSFQEIEVPWRHDDFDPTWAVGQDWDEVMAIRQRFLDCMDDDFNTGGAVGTLFELVNLLNRFVEKKQLQGAGRGTPVTNIFGKCTVVLRELTLILGLFIEKRRSRVLRVAAGVGKSYTGELLPWAELPHRQELTAELLKLAAEVAPGQLSEDSAQTDIIALILQLVARRNEARKAKDFATGDRIRGRLKELGILLEDKGGETDVRIEEAQRI